MAETVYTTSWKQCIGYTPSARESSRPIADRNIMRILSECSIQNRDDFSAPEIVTLAANGNYEELQETVSSLSEREINIKNHFGWTALRQACVGGHVSCIELLLSHGAQFDEPDVKGQTPLFSTVAAGQLEAMKILLKARANPNGSLKNRSCPLISAIVHGRGDMVQELLRHGAKPDCIRHQVEYLPSCPVNTALAYGHYDILNTILRYGATVNYEGVFDPIPQSPYLIVLTKNMPLRFFMLLYEFGCRYDNIIRQKFEEILADKNSQYKSTVLQLFDNPRSLKSSCRLAIFEMIRKPPEDHIGSLDIPHDLGSYLSYKEVT